MSSRRPASLPPTPSRFNEAGQHPTSSSRHSLSHRSRPVPPFGRHPAAKPVRTVRAAELARRNSRHNRSAAAPRLPLHNRSSRGWHQALGTGANRTAGARGARGAWAASAWAAGGWDGDGESSRPLRAEEVRLVLSSSVAHYETAVRPRRTNEARATCAPAGEHSSARPRPQPRPPSSPTRCLPATSPSHSRSRSLAGVRGRLPLQLDGVDTARHARRAQQRPRACRAAAAAAAACDVENKPEHGRPARPKRLTGRGWPRLVEAGPSSSQPETGSRIISRAERSHWRASWLKAEPACFRPTRRWRDHPRVHESPRRVATAKKFGSLLVAHVHNARHAAAALNAVRTQHPLAVSTGLQRTPRTKERAQTPG